MKLSTAASVYELATLNMRVEVTSVSSVNTVRYYIAIRQHFSWFFKEACTKCVSDIFEPILIF